MNIPASVRVIGDSAFEGCFDLTKLTLEHGSVLYMIGQNAFMGSGLTSGIISADSDKLPLFFPEVGGGAESGQVNFFLTSNLDNRPKF
jgi:hypothetical protein